VFVGRVGRPHGLDGSFYVVAANVDLLRGRTTLHIEGLVREITRRAGTEEHPILRLDDSASRDDAEALRGAELTVPREDVGLEEGEFWAHELAGCAVVDGDVAIGYVRRMSALPSCEVLEVDRPDGSELLVPMVRDAIRSIDVQGRRIDIDLEFLEG
jgi:16S rRNA processing protein RimM